LKRHRLRQFNPKDAIVTANIFYDAVNEGTREYYNEAQRHAWASFVPDIEPWRQRLQSQFTYIAENESEIIGFMTLDETGFIDLAYVTPTWIGKGVAKQIYDKVENHALSLKLTHLHTHASLMARKFFERQGWEVVKEQAIERNAASLTNFLMQKGI